MLFLFGILFVILGILALGSIASTALLTTFFFGWILLIGGITGIVYGLFAKGDKALYIIQGIIGLIVGGIVLLNPTFSLATITLIVAAYFLVGGAARVVLSVIERGPSWGWSLLGGIISFFLGMFVFYQWPVSGLFLIGGFIGIELLLLGTALIAAAFVPSESYDTSPEPQLYTGGELAGMKGGSAKKEPTTD